MHVKCLLVCCSNSSSRPAITSQTGNCLPTHHVYRTDTEMCGLCHLFAYELSSLNSLQNGKTKQQPPEISGNNELPHSSDFDPDGNNVGRLIPTQQEVQIMAESLWHLRPNTSKSKVHNDVYDWFHTADRQNCVVSSAFFECDLTL